MRKKPWAETEICNNSYVTANAKELKGKWHLEFGLKSPLHIELGAGKGKFIIEKAEMHPEINFIGIEKNLSVFAVASRKAREKGNLNNLKLIFADAGSVREMFGNGEVSAIYINFCDPWQKKRYEKRRLTHSLRLKEYGEILTEGGELVFKTDNRALFEFSLAELKKCGWIVKSISENLHNEDCEPLPYGNIMTEYEMKFSSAGQSIFRIIASSIAR